MKDIEEELRGIWKRASFNRERLEEDNCRAASLLATKNVVSAQQKLVRHYRQALIASFLMPVLSPILVELRLPVWIAAVYAIFGFVMAAVNISFYRYLREVQLMSLPVVQALARTVKIIRRQKLISVMSMTCAFMLCLMLMAQAFVHSEMAVLFGMVFGLLLAIVIAVVKYRKITRLANRIKAELSSLLKE